jgi:hypothetical protein
MLSLKRLVVATAAIALSAVMSACTSQTPIPPNTSPSTTTFTTTVTPTTSTTPPVTSATPTTSTTPPVTSATSTTSTTSTTPTAITDTSTATATPTDTTTPDAVDSTSTAATPESVYGLYVGLGVSDDPNSYTSGISNKYVTFLPDGTILRGLPTEGPEAYVPGGHQVVDTGTYMVADGIVTVTWSGGETVQITALDEEGLFFDLYGARYGYVDPLTNTTLDGTYSRGSGGSGARITFTPDGAFSDEGITGDTGLMVTTNPSGTGHYSISRNTLTLQYDHGTVQSISIYPLDEAKHTLSQLVLAGFVFAQEYSGK